MDKDVTPSYLDSAVAPIGYDDVSVGVDRNARGSVELAVSFPVGAKLQEQLPLGGENLRRKDGGLVSVPSGWGSLRSHLHRVVVEVGHDDLVVLVHCSKVRTCARAETGPQLYSREHPPTLLHHKPTCKLLVSVATATKLGN